MKPFDLSPELLNQIIHAMENQNADFLLDSTELVLLDAARVPEPEDPTLIPVPTWEPSDGFAVMEGFAGSLSDVEWKERLREALHGGRGAFKRFKAAVKDNHYLEAQWRRYKRRRMQRVVYSWYNDLRRHWGLNPVEPQEGHEDFESLLLEDFEIRSTRLGTFRSDIQRLHRAAHLELCRKLPAGVAEALYDEPSWAIGGDDSTEPAPDGILALAPEEEVAGVVWGRRRDVMEELEQILVLPLFRGIGLGALLFDRWVEGAIKSGARYLMVRRGAGHPALRSLSEGRGFEMTDVGYLLDVNRPE